jgi:Polysaccharide lyase family 8, super-sandwich domain/Polysaccharide lyase family 8, N terminal alpha-helical domain
MTVDLICRAATAILLAVACVFLTIAPAAAVSFDPGLGTDDELRLVAQRLHDQTTGAPNAEALDAQVRALLDAQNRTVGDALFGAFADVKPRDDKHIDFARGYFDPIRVLSRAYALPTSTYHKSEAVADAIRTGFEYTRKHVHPGCEKPGNWWVWAKQMPDCLCDILALLADDMHPDDKAYLVSVLDYLIGEGPLKGSGYHTGKAGKDAVNVLKAGVLTGDRERIAHAQECMENEVGPYLLEPDGTPLMTVIKDEFLGVSLPYVYEGYETIVEWVRMTQGTSMALRPETSGKLTDYALGLGRWNTLNNTEVAWIGFTPYQVFWQPARTLALARTLGTLEVPRADEAKAMGAGTDAPPDGIRFWPAAETLIYRSPDFYCALVMASENRHQVSWSYKNYFLHIGQKWYYGRDGMLILASRPEDTHPNLSYTLNWNRLSGVTHDDGSVLESDQRVMEDHGYWQPAYIYCKNPFAGAAVLDGFAAAGLEVHSGNTRARKSFHFVHECDLIVMLGSGIQGRGDTVTTVHTFPTDETGLVVNGTLLALTDGTPATVETPAWIHGPAGGYYFSESGQVTLLAETREPDFEDHGNLTPDRRPEVAPGRFVSIYFDHGANPSGATYAAACYPKASLEQMPDLARDFAASASFSRDAAGHAFSYGSHTGLVFFEPGSLKGYAGDRPCFLALRGGAAALYEPSWEKCQLSLGLPFTPAPQPLPDGLALDGATLSVDVKPGVPVRWRFASSE